ncbi:MAG: branched-chain amino acid ABC transporter permease [Actinomycetes bacterium]|jgi:branched-chain amino acid transport system permease protein
MSPTLIRGIFDVLSLSSVLILLVIGMAIIVGMMKVFNMCQGELVLLGAVTAFLCGKYLGNLWIGILLAPIVVGLFGLLLERTIIHRFYVNPQGALLATFAIGLIMRESLRTRMSTQSSPVDAPIQSSINIGGASLPVWRIVIMVVTLLLALAIGLVLLKTNLGMKVRATLDNPDLVSVSGISTKWMYAGTYALGSALSGFAGAMIVPLQTLYPNLGYDNLILMFIAVMIGGLGQFGGPLAGAALIAVPGAILGQFISPVTGQILVVFLAIIFMRFRPVGIFQRGR